MDDIKDQMCDLQTSVEVALRIRPLVSSEVQKGCKNILEVFKDLNQVRIKNGDKSFSYNHVFDFDTTQEYFYDKCIKPLVPNLFKGYNVTVLAYGQTGSGKTHSMGTNYSGIGEMGTIPRAMQDIFNYIESNNDTYNFEVTVSFIELYQEVLYDLLSNKSREECVLDIREDAKGTCTPGLTHEPVTSTIEAFSMLLKGSQRRAVGSTNMNKESSRSHAIFTINIRMTEKDSSMNPKTAKFHLVDLAGSERSKKTGATGKTFKEGVNINKGLLALGNVISALGDEKYNQGYISYRDSNLTRLLKDSLGGNSLTLMIACVSPADYNLDETISTLRYADRARKIKNKPIVNEDVKGAEISRLNNIINDLRLQLAGEGNVYTRTGICPKLEEKCSDLMIKLSSTLSDKALLHEKLMMMQTINDNSIQIVSEIKEKLSSQDQENDQNYANGDSNSIIDCLKTDLQKLEMCLKNSTDELEKDEALFNSKDFLSESILKERNELYTTNQLALSSELEKVSKMLAIKEGLAKQMMTNANYMVADDSLNEKIEKIKQLEKEKESLLTKLNQTKNQDASNKTVTLCKKQIQDLEHTIYDLRKKVAEQTRVLKLKAKDEAKIGVLNNDILTLKQTKVKLIKNMKEESEKFRRWKIEKERELSKLKQQDRKRQNEMVKMEKLHNRQQNVLKRKVEEAAAINKRLKDALALRKAAKEQKANTTGVQKIGHWIQQEIDLFINVIDARCTVDILIEDRSILQEQLDILKNNSEINLDEVNQLQNDIEIRSAQISDFQQKILDSDEESKSKQRWDNIHSMAEAKHAFTILFDKISEIRHKACQTEMKTTELQQFVSDYKKRNTALVKQLEDQENYFKNQLDNIERVYEEKVSVLLNEIHKIEINKEKEGEASNVFTVQMDFINNLEETNKVQKEKIEILETKIVKLHKENDSLQQRFSEINDVIIHEKRDTRVKQNNSVAIQIQHDSDHENGYVSDDNKFDPDWRKTPLAKRIKSMKYSADTSQAIKRNHQGRCACKRSCNTKSCGCQKLKINCSILCKCSKELCENKNNSFNDNDMNSSNESNKKLRVDDSDLSTRSFIVPKRNLFPESDLN